MDGSGSHTIQAVFLLLLLFVIVFAALAQRLRVPYPIVLVVAGLALGFVPGLPSLELQPDAVFFIFLPLLLYSAAWQTSWVSFRENARDIASLAIGLVVFTVFGVAFAAPLFLTGFDWRAGFILGAVIAPTDAIAATAIARRLGLRKRLVDIIEGESLVNDATGLLALRLGLGMLLAGRIPTVSESVLQFVYVSLIGAVIGLALGFVVERFERLIDDAPIVIAITILVPYASYFAAEAVHASGVLAVVVCGLFHSRRSDQFRSARVRLEASVVWNALTFILNGLLFVLIGLQLRPLLRDLEGGNAMTVVAQGFAFSILVIALRLVWVVPAMALTGIGASKAQAMSFRDMFVVGWSSMRGVIALAAAMSLPRTLPDGSPFVQRTMIIVLTFAAIFLSLVVKGATLPLLIRKLGLSGQAAPEVEDRDARRIVIEAALGHLEALHAQGSVFDELYEDLRRHYEARLAAITNDVGDEHGSALEHVAQYRDLSRQLLQQERRTAVRLRSESRISDDVLRDLLADLDLEETRLSLELPRA
jgi:CPA1 family monovalent cation:H+ antiporter